MELKPPYSQPGELMYKEILEAPQAIRRILKEERARVESIVDHLRRRRIDFVMVVARGTSDHAAQLAKYLFEYENGLAVSLAAPSIFTRYAHSPNLSNALVIGISQSGEGPDIIEVVERAKQQGAATVGITNSADSGLAKTAEFLIDCRASEERSVAATKTYITQLVSLYMLSLLWSGNQDAYRELERFPETVEQAISSVDEKIGELAIRLAGMDHCIVIGRGFNYCTALESSLKLKETAYILSEAYSSADFLHGPIAVIEQGFPAFVIAPDGPVLDDLVSLSDELGRRGAELTIMTTQGAEANFAKLKASKTVVSLPYAGPELLSPMILIVPMQLLACRVSVAKGFDPDRPRGLNKVTKTH